MQIVTNFIAIVIAIVFLVDVIALAGSAFFVLDPLNVVKQLFILRCK